MNSPFGLNLSNPTFEKICFWALALYLIAALSTNAGMAIFSVPVYGLLVGVAVWNRRTPTTAFAWSALLFVFVAWLSFEFSKFSGIIPGEKNFLIEGGKLRCFLTLFGSALIWQILDEPKRNKLVFLYLGVAGVWGIYGIVQHFTPLDIFRPDHRGIIELPSVKGFFHTTGPFNHHLSFANAFTFPFALALGGFFVSTRWRLWFGVLATVLGVAIFYSYSRVAWIMLLVMALLTVIKVIPRFRIAISLVVLLGAFFTTFFFEPVRHRIFDQTLVQRELIWKANWMMFKEHPLLGVGYNQNEYLSGKYVYLVEPNGQNLFVGHAHNNFLQILSSTGIIGISVFVFFWLSFLFPVTRAYLKSQGWDRVWLLGVLLALFGFHINGLTQWNFGDAEVNHNLMIVMGLGWALKNRVESASSSLPHTNSQA